MTEHANDRRPLTAPTPAQVASAIRYTYAQMMLNAVFAASTGGMFLIGFALLLGADNVKLGWMSSIPQLFVVFQIPAAFLIERGMSRKGLTVAFAFVVPLCWFLIAGIPFFAAHLSVNGRMAMLIAVICLVTTAAQFVGNARSVWIGDLIPAEQRGRFFGYCTLFAGSVAAIFAVAEGRFLDFIKSHGLYAFAGLFFFGAAFGLVSAALNLPQADCPAPPNANKPTFGALVRETFRNRPFVALAIVHATVALGGIAGPFNVAYCIRDVGLSFFGLGLLNAVATVAVLLSSPWWGKMVDRHGCRPILILGLLIMAPCASIWMLIPPHTPMRAYVLLPWTNFISGLGSAAFSVAISTMVYKLTKAEGRAVQFALYSIFVTLIGAPMPLLGGWLVDYLGRHGWEVDLRLTFYLWSEFVFTAVFLALRLREPKSTGVRALVFSYFPNQLTRFWGSVAATTPFFSSFLRFEFRARRENGDDEPEPKP